MKKLLAIALCTALFTSVFSQKVSTRTAKVNFEASVPSFEEVAAKNNQSSAVLDLSNGNLAVLSLIKAFKFKVALMEEHFNENYINSKKYPKATFKGKILDYHPNLVTNSTKTIQISGYLELNGVKKKITTKATIVNKSNKTLLKGSFKVKPADFNIAIPKVVSKKIADDVVVSFDMALAK